MDDAMVQMLEDLPADLRERGWTFAPRSHGNRGNHGRHRALPGIGRSITGSLMIAAITASR